MQKIFVISYRTMNSFFTIKSPSDGLFKDKGSRFISFAFPVSSAEEAMAIVKQKRKEFFDARHVCYAYMIGSMREEFRTNDDGEPSGTAGRPILGQINAAQLTDILVIVVRYFGGTLLGTSGLINAYKTASAEAIANAQTVEIPIEKYVKIECSYDNINYVMRLIKDLELKIISQQQTTYCSFTLSCKQVFWEQLLQRLADNHLIKFEFA